MRAKFALSAVVNAENLAALGNAGLCHHGVAAKATAFVTRKRRQFVGDLGRLAFDTGHTVLQANRHLALALAVFDSIRRRHAHRFTCRRSLDPSATVQTSRQHDNAGNIHVLIHFLAVSCQICARLSRKLPGILIAELRLQMGPAAALMIARWSSVRPTDRTAL